MNSSGIPDFPVSTQEVMDQVAENLRINWNGCAASQRLAARTYNSARSGGGQGGNDAAVQRTIEDLAYRTVLHRKQAPYRARRKCWADAQTEHQSALFRRLTAAAHELIDRATLPISTGDTELLNTYMHHADLFLNCGSRYSQRRTFRAAQLRWHALAKARRANAHWRNMFSTRPEMRPHGFPFMHV